MGHFERSFQREGVWPTNHSWCQSSRVIALSCGIKISAAHRLVLSQSTRVTDRRTELRLPRPPSHAREVKTLKDLFVHRSNAKYSKLTLAICKFNCYQLIQILNLAPLKYCKFKQSCVVTTVADVVAD